MVCGACIMAPVAVASAFGASTTAQRNIFLISLGILFFSTLFYYYYLSTCQQCSTDNEEEEKTTDD